jgi:competence CoiA-like predicted nuclease
LSNNIQVGGVYILLTARTKSGKQICLGYDYKKEVLQTLRNKEEFHCPVCGEKVILKLGEQRIFHFAHNRGGDCRDLYEHESIYHMEGKRQLFQWLNRQRIRAELEYYDKEIQQRPDVVFFHNGKKFALEYQCSTIPESIFMKRTKNYIQNGYHPLWIIGGNHIHQKKKNIVSLSNFHYLFMRGTTEGKYYIPSYCPNHQSFHIVGSILSYSVKNAFVQTTFIPLNKLVISTLLNPHLKEQLPIDSWHRELDKSHLHWSLHQSPQQQRFLHEIYHQNLNPYLLPPEIGLPVRHSILITTSPIIWQTYLYLDGLATKQPGGIIRLEDIRRSINRRIKRKEIIIRNLPQFEHTDPLDAIIDYLFQLENLGFLSRKGEGIFLIKKQLKIPMSNREKEENMKAFYQKYRRIYVKG